MKLEDILNYSPERTAVPLRKRALRWLAAFLAVMAVCTVLSRAADSLTVAVVTTQHPESGAVQHTVETDGTLEAQGEIAVFTLEGMRVRSVGARTGERVAAGDVLFTVDPDDIARKLTEQQLELQKLQLSLSQIQQNAKTQAERDALAEIRAQEDFDIAAEKLDLRIKQAGEDRRRAKNALRDYKNETDFEEEDEDLNDYDLDPTYISLRDDYRANQLAYEEAVAEQRDEQVKLERTLEDLRLKDVDNQAQIQAIECSLKQLEIARLTELSAAGGEVTAPSDAVVTSVDVKAGGQTGTQAAVMLAGQETELRFTAEIPKEEQKYISPGDAIALTLPDRSKVEAIVESVAAIEEKNGLLRLTALLPAGEGTPGALASMTAQKRSSSYPTCVPVDALHSDGNQDYVYILRTTETVLGTEQTVERVDVTVQEKNESRAAVTGALDSTDDVIITSNKTIGSGDRVRVEAAG